MKRSGFLFPIMVILSLLGGARSFGQPDLSTHLTACLPAGRDGQASRDYLSGQAQISLITCDPGTELYSVFGHTAIRVNDPVKGFDLVYNFGTFDFNTPNFYLKFIRGRLMYTLARYKFSDFKIEYVMSNRSVYEQILNLSKQEKERLFYLLEVHYLPENRYYLYDFFYTNCTTKVIDIIESALDNPNYFAQFSDLQELTFRQNLALCLEHIPWTKLGIDLLLGIPSDKTMTIRESMFLPLELMKRVDHEKERDLFGEIKILFQAEPDEMVLSRWRSPRILFWGLFVLILIATFFERKKDIRMMWPDTILFSMIGLLGIQFTLLWAFSDHEGMNGNLNILWAFPLHFPLFLIRRLLGNKIFNIYILSTGILLLLTTIFLKLIPQEFNTAIFPLCLILLTRLSSVYIKNRKLAVA